MKRSITFFKKTLYSFCFSFRKTGEVFFMKFPHFKWRLIMGISFSVFFLVGIQKTVEGKVVKTMDPIELSGTVIDSVSGEPLAGATVQVEGKTIGGITNENGQFSLEVDENDVLVVSSVGYTTKFVSVSGMSSIEIALASSSLGLDQLIVVGYGTQKKKDVTGSISEIKGSHLVQSPAPNISNSVAGRIPGVILNNRSGEPGNDASEILIRGKGSLNDNSPLIIIDGIPDRGDFDRLNPNDIESVTVLKDASAAIYGARSANGVILIETKKGELGKPVIEYDGSFGLTEPTRLPKLIGAGDYTLWKNEISDRKGEPHEFTDEQVEGYRQNSDPLKYPNTDWYQVILKPVSPQTKHSLSVRGGNEKVKYYVSGNYLYQDGLFRNSSTNYHQYNLRSNIDANITDNFSVSLGVSGRLENRNYSNFAEILDGGYTIWKVALSSYPTLPDFYPNGLPGPGVELGMNPALMVDGTTGFYKVKDYFFRSNLSFRWDISQVKGLFVQGVYAYDFNSNNPKQFNSNWDVFQYNSNTDTYDNIKEVEGPINLNESFRNFENKTFNIRLGYNRNFDGHSIDAFVAYEQNGGRDEGISAYRTDFPNGNAPYLNFGGNGGKDNTGNANHYARQHVFGRVGYGYKDKYLGEVIIREDGSYIFPSKKKWGTFPAFSVGYRISEEPFFNSAIPLFNEFKVKFSWGRLGNDKILPYQGVQLYNVDAGYYFGPTGNMLPGITAGVVPNPNVTWETATTSNIGIETSLFNNLLNFNADYFSSRRSNILLPREASIPTATGLVDKLPDENIGKVLNRGGEFEIFHNREVNANFSYNIGANFTYTKNRILFMDEAVNTPDWQKQQGHPMDSWLVYRTDGLYKSDDEINSSPHLSGTRPGDLKYIDVNEDGSISSDDMIRIYESATPNKIFGLSMGVNYKGIGLNLLWQGQAGAKQLIQPQQGETNTPTVRRFKERWTPNNPNGTQPFSFDRTDEFNNREADFWLEDATFLRLKTAELSYSFPKDITDKLNLNNLRVYVSGFNLFVLSKMKEYDPEIISERGISYPQTRIYNVGVNISF